MEEKSSDSLPIIGRGLLILFGGGWIAIECATNLIEFARTNAITVPDVGKAAGYATGPITILYATHPILAITVIGFTAICGLLGLAGVVIGLFDVGKTLRS